MPEQAVIMNYCRPEEQVKQTLVRPPELHDCTHTGNKSIPAVHGIGVPVPRQTSRGSRIR